MSCVVVCVEIISGTEFNKDGDCLCFNLQFLNENGQCEGIAKLKCSLKKPEISSILLSPYICLLFSTLKLKCVFYSFIILNCTQCTAISMFASLSIISGDNGFVSENEEITKVTVGKEM